MKLLFTMLVAAWTFYLPPNLPQTRGAKKSVAPMLSAIERNPAFAYGAFSNKVDIMIRTNGIAAAVREKSMGIPNLAMSDTVFLLDTIVTYDFSSDDTSRMSFSYNSNGKCVSEMNEQRQYGQWINSFRTTFNYDLHGNEITTLGEQWQYGIWMKSSFDTMAYDSKGNMLTSLLKLWLGQWINIGFDTMTYDSYGNMLTDLGMEWQNDQWVILNLDNYSYDSIGNMLTVLGEVRQNGQWVYSWLDTMTYDANGNELTWLEKEWQNGQWTISRRGTMTYDSNGNQSTALVDLWQNGTWTTAAIMIYTWGIWQITGVKHDKESVPAAFSLSQNYPNPFNPTTNFEFRIADFGLVTLKVYNILGKEVATIVNKELPAGDYKYQWDAGNLASGVYFYRIIVHRHNGLRFTSVKKLVLMK